MPMATVAYAVFPFVFVACLACAAANDLRDMRIPNWISLALVALFAGYAVINGAALPVQAHLAVGVGTLAVTFVIFAAGALGAGDAKLLSALALWMGPENGPAFLAMVAILGGLFALLLMAAHRLARRYAGLNDYTVFATSSRLMRAGKLPYGVPISLSAAAMVPTIF